MISKEELLTVKKEVNVVILTRILNPHSLCVEVAVSLYSDIPHVFQ